MQFEDLLVRENMEMNRQMDMPVTGLERMDETRHVRMSPRSRARRRIGQSSDLLTVINDSRFMAKTARRVYGRKAHGTFTFSPDLEKVHFPRCLHADMFTSVPVYMISTK